MGAAVERATARALRPPARGLQGRRQGRFSRDPTCEVLASRRRSAERILPPRPERLALTAASCDALVTALVVDQGRKVAVLEQRTGCIHRLGQTDPIDVYSLVSQDSIESRIAPFVSDKRAVLRVLFDGESDAVGRTPSLEAMEAAFADLAIQRTPQGRVRVEASRRWRLRSPPSFRASRRHFWRRRTPRRDWLREGRAARVRASTTARRGEIGREGGVSSRLVPSWTSRSARRRPPGSGSRIRRLPTREIMEPTTGFEPVTC